MIVSSLVAANSCKPAATPQEQLREPERDLQHDAGAPQRRLEVDRGRCAGTFRCAQHPYSHPFTSHHPSLVPTGFHAAAAQTDREGAGADPIGRLEEELNQLGDASYGAPYSKKIVGPPPRDGVRPLAFFRVAIVQGSS